MQNDLHDETLTPQCPRCPGCDGLTHHWLADVDDNENPSYDYVCKHCSVVGMLCTSCEGYDHATDPDCSACHGEGVLRIGGLRVEYLDDDEED